MGVRLLLSLILYVREDALTHFVWHLGYGGSAGLLLGAALAGVRRRPPPTPMLWPLASYLWMILPDFLWLAPTLTGHPPHEHQAWMNVFLAHVALDGWPLATPLLAPVILASAVVFGGVAWFFHRQRERGEEMT